MRGRGRGGVISLLVNEPSSPRSTRDGEADDSAELDAVV